MTARADPLVARAEWHLEIGYPEADGARSCELGCYGCDECTDYDDQEPADRFCPACAGTGRDPWNDYILPCEHCDGEGTAWWL